MTLEEKDARQSQRLELIGQLASGVAHDLNNQLTVILNHLDFAQMQLDPSNAVRQHLMDVQRAAMRCTEMTQALLGFGRRGAQGFAIIDLGPLLSETVRLVRRIIPSTIEITLSVDPRLERVEADATQIQQVLLNVFINARDAMPEGGRLAIRAENDDGLVVITVEDNGCGMPPEVLKHAFTPFFTTKRGKGTGLGLTMVGSIMEQHHGNTEIQSAEGHGTTVLLTFPAIEPAARPKNGSAGCILVADDDDLVRNAAANALSLRGYRVIQARDGEETVRLFASHEDEIDLLFLDFAMPRLSGAEALERARSRKPNVKALLTSGYDVTVREAFLSKPYRVEELAGKVKELIAKAA